MLRLLCSSSLLAGALFACAADSSNSTGSQQMVTDGQRLYVANADSGSVSAVDLVTYHVQEISVGLEPTRLAVASNGRIFVTLRGERSVAVLRSFADGVAPETTIGVGAEPFGVVYSQQRQAVYVASAMSGRVDEIDVQSLLTLRSWNVEDEPRWLAIHPSGDGLYVTSAYRGRVTFIDLADSDEPPQSSFVTDPDRLGSVRNTGDPAVTPDGDHLLLPVLWVDNVSPVKESDEEPPVSPDPAPPVDARLGGYASGPGPGGRNPSRFRPVVVMADLGGRPDLVDARWIAPILPGTQATLAAPTSYISAVAPSPDGERAVIAMEGAQRIAVMPLFEEEVETSPAFEGVQAAFVRTAAGPTSVLFQDDISIWTYAFLDRSVARAQLARGSANDEINRYFTGGFDPIEAANISKDTIAVSESTIPSSVENGRRLFYSTSNPSITSRAAGVSCATCHFGSRNDGLTWQFERGPRQTPSLAGRVSMTNPVRWDGSRTSVADDARRTAFNLMGGAGLTYEQGQMIQAFVDWTPDVDNPRRGDSDPAVARGKAIFERADTQCATCHSGERLTDNLGHNLFGFSNVQTPPLVGIAATAPYFHDGSAQSLREVLERVRDGSMGSTGRLTDEEMDDLELYLGSL